MAYFIIKSNRKVERNWSGKEWSPLPAKIYTDFQEASEAIQQYWYGSWNSSGFDNRRVIFVPLTDEKTERLVKENEARW